MMSFSGICPSPARSLSRFPLASLRELIFLSLPITIMLMSNSAMVFFDRLFLAWDSRTSLDACVNAVFLSSLFQLCLTYWTGMAHVFVGQCMGSGQLNKVGVYVWQMIWLSIFSTFVTLPLGYLTEYVFLRNTSVQAEASVYFRVSIYFNLLWPLGSALASFFLGRGKMLYVLWVTLAANLLNIILDRLLIFGLSGWIPHFGILGAALATCISQGFLCTVLFVLFLNKKNREIYGTGCFSFEKTTWKQCLKIGLFRSLSRMVTMSAWLASFRLMTLKGGNYLLVLSITSTFNTLFLFIIDGMTKGLMTIASYLIGRMDSNGIRQLMRSTFLLLLFGAIIVFFPCFVFAKPILSLFFDYLDSGQMALLVRALKFVWCYFIAYGLNQIAFTLISSAGDTFFTMVYNLLARWPLTYISVFLAMQKWEYSPDKFYLILSIGAFTGAVVYFLRFFKKEWKSLVTQYL